MKCPSCFLLLLFICFAFGKQNPPFIPQVFAATTLTVEVEDSIVNSKVKSSIYYDASNNRTRVDSLGLTYNFSRSEIYRGDVGEYYLISYWGNGKDLCIEVQAPHTLPYILEIPVLAKFSGYDKIDGVTVSVWKHTTQIFYINSANNYPVRIITGTPINFQKVDFISFVPGNQDESLFEVSRSLNCTKAIYPGRNKIMTKEELVKHLTFKPSTENNKHIPIDSKRQVNPADIIAIGQEIWQIIVDNKPSADVNTLSNGVIPDGASFSDMSGWQQYSWNPFEWKWTNLYGITVVDFQWSFDWNCNGTYGPNNVGQYIMNAGGFPQSIDVAWGYTVNVNGQILTPLNIGTQDQPIAQITTIITMQISTIIQTNQQSCQVNMNGDCTSAMVHCDQYQQF